MVYQNVEVWKKMAMMALEAYRDAQPIDKAFAVTCIELLDPTFEAPIVNINCRCEVML